MYRRLRSATHGLQRIGVAPQDAATARRWATTLLVALLAALASAALTAFALGPQARVWQVLLAAVGGMLLVIAIESGVRTLHAQSIHAAAADRVLSLPTPLTEAAVLDAIAGYLADPTVLLRYRERDSLDLLDGDGLRAALTAGRRTEGVLPDELGPTVILEYGPEARVSPARRDAVLSAAALALDHLRLQALLRAQLLESRSSRTRLVRAALDERRLLEEGLHDGAQASLFAAIAEITRARSRTHDDATTAGIDRATALLTDSIGSVRALVRTRIVPSALREAGLAAALVLSTEDLPVRVTIHAPDAVPLADEATEIAGYLTVVDVMRAAEHAGATVASVWLARIDASLDIFITCDRPLVAMPVTVGERVRGLAGTFELADSPGTAELRVGIPCES